MPTPPNRYPEQVIITGQDLDPRVVEAALVVGGCTHFVVETQPASTEIEAVALGWASYGDLSEFLSANRADRSFSRVKISRIWNALGGAARLDDNSPHSRVRGKVKVSGEPLVMIELFDIASDAPFEWKTWLKEGTSPDVVAKGYRLNLDGLAVLMQRGVIMSIPDIGPGVTHFLNSFLHARYVAEASADRDITI